MTYFYLLIGLAIGVSASVTVACAIAAKRNRDRALKAEAHNKMLTDQCHTYGDMALNFQQRCKNQSKSIFWLLEQMGLGTPPGDPLECPVEEM